ncbi:ATP-binding protein [Kitasatospora sp. NPDC093558]|uniref:ATP-binding protein n=1 Tax=Kitasatospora sp. NPDC093558 TaxID=3155201 RepID=UPI00343D4BAE
MTTALARVRRPRRRGPGPTVTRTVDKTTRCDLVVVDDIGMPPCGQAAAEAFDRVIAAAHERRSVVATGNLHPSGFDSIMPKTLATAAVDRLLHHAHIVLTGGHQPPPRAGHRRQGRRPARPRQAAPPPAGAAQPTSSSS